MFLSGCDLPNQKINESQPIKDEVKVNVENETSSTTEQLNLKTDEKQPAEINNDSEVKSDDSEGEDSEENDDNFGEKNSPVSQAVPAPVPTPIKSDIITTEKSYTTTEVAAANTASKCWTIVNGSVYDLTSYTNAHKGGSSAILSLCGKNGSAAFSGQHGGQNKPAYDLSKLFIGKLK